jgi:hypothetical protein
MNENIKDNFPEGKPAHGADNGQEIKEVENA